MGREIAPTLQNFEAYLEGQGVTGWLAVPAVLLVEGG